MSAPATTLSRQWIPIPGGSCDVRLGFDAIGQASGVLQGSVGKPRRCIIVLEADADAELAESLRRQVVDAGFAVGWHTPEQSHTRSVEAAAGLLAALAEQELTADDLCCVLGDADLISMASYVCDAWCTGMAMVAFPTDEVAFLEGALVPRALDVAGVPRMVSVRPCARHVFADFDLMLSDVDDEAARHARVLMVAAAMCSSEREFSELWDRAPKIMEGDVVTTTNQLVAAGKARGQTAASTSAAVRQSIEYGRTFAAALDAILQRGGERQPQSILLAEGLRFAARVSVMLEKISIDDMLAQDELLDALGIGSIACDVDAAELCAALRNERFLRTNRFMLLVPMAIGRVRLTTVEDELLEEHARAWCNAHRR